MIDPWEIPTRSLRLRLPSPEDDRQTLRPESIEPMERATPSSPEITVTSVEDTSPPAAPEKPASIATRIGRKMRLLAR